MRKGHRLLTKLPRQPYLTVSMHKLSFSHLLQLTRDQYVFRVLFRYSLELIRTYNVSETIRGKWVGRFSLSSHYPIAF